MSRFSPTPADKFSFGLWTVGNPGRDPFGEPTRSPRDPVGVVEKLAELGAYGVCLHDNDLIPWETPAAAARQITRRFAAALARTGLVCSMATTNLFSHPAFKDGAFTANDPKVRRFALHKAMRGIDLGAELGAPVYVFWGGREGGEVHAARDARLMLERYREALDILCAYVRDQGYPMRFAVEPKPNEPRGDILLPTVGHALAFIQTLAAPDMVGVNPEVAHETMAGLSFVHAVAQAIDAGKLFHVDLNSQKPGRFDQDLRFGAEDPKEAFYLVKLLEESGYDGVRHFDAHPLRVEGERGVWEFARGCMRTYLILKAKARAFAESPAIRQALADAQALDRTPIGPYSPELAASLKRERFAAEAMGARDAAHERLDQLVMDLLLGELDG